MLFCFIFFFMFYDTFNIILHIVIAWLHSHIEVTQAPLEHQYGSSLVVISVEKNNLKLSQRFDSQYLLVLVVVYN
jgi:hypothetical protein